MGALKGLGGDVCELRPAEFRGAPCSDLVGQQRPIAELLPGECGTHGCYLSVSPFKLWGTSLMTGHILLHNSFICTR